MAIISGVDTATISPQYLRYFIFSTEQLKLFKELHQKLGRTMTMPTVFVAGRRKPYTEMVRDPNNCRYSDYYIVAAGDIRKMQYTEWDI